ncbi:aspartate/glutamate racemase family protein [Paraburkholderia sp. MMS20-SJTN17]|uniref:Aspartate/glutamate racemase family protein n=1 Tax=Paraburkholderia translucens TaxID=2886945 RepID=A0ABS8KAW9_9BURK|nr:aspartate/glutamate racemase family protein [Paraburkholderia sp. MMS20-SJTN17]MCC8401603.1 aspartate/glutamate racemase family protein [Paraburkholderia sp. MMS20-SJTN17]
MSTTSLRHDAYTKLEFTLDDGIASRAAIGLVVLATDHTIEHEWRQLLRQDGVAFYESRLQNSPDITPARLAEIESRIAPAVGLLLPGERLDVVAFGCTSASMVIGEEPVFGRTREARPGIACTTPITAALAALAVLQVRRVALLTPYIRSINDFMRDYIEARGVAVTRIASFEHADDNAVARIDASSIRAAIEQLARHADADAVFVSCTSLRVAALIPHLEETTGKPVISSNFAMAWHALRLAGVRDSEPQLGQLFAL